MKYLDSRVTYDEILAWLFRNEFYDILLAFFSMHDFYLLGINPYSSCIVGKH